MPTCDLDGLLKKRLGVSGNGTFRNQNLPGNAAQLGIRGELANRVTNVPGSSAVFIEGNVTYSNGAKTRTLGVSAELISSVGAVSEEVARAMAEGALQRSGATFALSTTGIAGPDGGTADKPVGTVCFALAAAEVVHHRRYQLWGNREWVKLLSSQVALDWVRRAVLGLPVTESYRPLR